MDSNKQRFSSKTTQALLKGVYERADELARINNLLMLQRGEGGFPQDTRLFNEVIGNPVHPVMNVPFPLQPHQIVVMDYPGKALIVNKSNKLGMTEAVLRDMIKKGVPGGDCSGYLMMLGAQDLDLAKENLHRMTDMFEGSPALSRLIRDKPTATRLKLTNGTRYITMPRNARAMRGWARLKYAFMDEAAHTGLLDDEPILAATVSRLSNTNGYLRICSTPDGVRGFFYRLYMLARQGKVNLKAMEFNYTVSIGRPEEGKLITEEFIADARDNLGPLFDQEFMCQFLSSESAAIPPELVDNNLEDYGLEQV